MFTTLDKIKAHLNIDLEYTEDDELLILYAQTAEEAISKHINCPLSHLLTAEGYIPSSIQSAILLLIGNLYANREPVSIGGNPIKIPYTLEYLIDLNKNYRHSF